MTFLGHFLLFLLACAIGAGVGAFFAYMVTSTRYGHGPF